MENPRFDRLTESLKSAGLDGIALNPGPTLTYLTGLTFHLMERPVILLIVPPAQPVLVLPELELRKVEVSRIPVKAFPYNDNPATWNQAFHAAAGFCQLDQKMIGVEPTRLRYMELQFLQNASISMRLTSGEGVVSALRISKDPLEIDYMRKAVQIAQAALGATLKTIRVGQTERQVASELSIQLLRAGSDSEMPFSPIIAGGPNSANPHAAPSERVLQAGDMLVIDWGASYQGYCSDLTRTFVIGRPDPEFMKIALIVEESNAAGRAIGCPGIPAGSVDQAARKVIVDSGYGPFFTHRTGHGLGMEGHEPPYMFGENPLLLSSGMTYTVEPGIYLPGRGGVRIEDNIVITDNGCETLSNLSRDLIVIE